MLLRVFPNYSGKEVGGIVSFDVMLLNGLRCVGSEGRDLSIKAKSDEDEDEKDEIDVKYRTLSNLKEVLLGAVETNAKLGIQIREKRKDNGK